MPKLECLKIIQIGQLAAELRTEEGSTTKLPTTRWSVQYYIKQKGCYYEKYSY